MEIKPLSQANIQPIADCFNQAFEDYFVKFNATPEYLAERWHTAGVDYSMSFGCYDNNKLVGFVIHGTNPERGEAYNAGTGVIPEFRRKGIVKKLYEAAIPVLKKNAIRQVRLEVITKNQPAINAYSTLGFKEKRKLLCFRGQVNIESTGKFRIQKTDAINTELFRSFLDVEPSWENGFDALIRKREPLEIYEIMGQEKVIGFGIRFSGTGYIPLLGIHPEFRRIGAGKELFSYLSANTSEVRLNNIDSRSLPMTQFLTKVGLENHLNQFEMILKI